MVEKTSFKLYEYTNARPPPREGVDLFARITLYPRGVNCGDKAESLSVNHMVFNRCLITAITETHVSVIAVIKHLESIID